MLDCPVSGTGSQARTGDLVIYASGDRKSRSRKVKPMFAGFSRKMYDLGAFGNGSKMKYVANLLVAINNVASAEAMVLGMKAGLDPQRHLRDDLERRRQFARVRTARADDGEGRLQRRHHEMLGLAEGHGRDRRLRQEMGVPTPLFSATLPVYAAALKSGHAEHDTAAVCAVLEAKAERQAPQGALTIEWSRSEPSAQ